MHPEIVVSAIPMGLSMQGWESGDHKLVAQFLRRGVEQVAAAGADFFICPDNTAHIALEAPGPPLQLPGLHIAEIVARRARSEGHTRVGLLGTRWTMTGPVYPAAFARAGLEMRTPDETDRNFVDRVIFDELCQGVIRDASRTETLRIIADLKRAGCDSVALSCTELPLLVTPDVSPLPTLDSTRLLARTAVAVSLGDTPLPTWRGGPF